jgi:homoserine dehydrogenase
MQSKEIRLALIGLGNVGQGFLQIVQNDRLRLAEQGLAINVVAVCDLHRGSAADAKGLDVSELLSALAQGGRIDGRVKASHSGWDALTTIAESQADVIVELSWSDFKTGEPALSHVRAALRAGQHVITSNKGPIALAYKELRTLAEAHQAQLCIEGTVMSGTPSLRLASDCLKAAGIQKVQGIVNGTTNYMLTAMNRGVSYFDALKQAQELGFAEADPTSDVEGFDAAAIMAQLLFDAPLQLSDVDRTGIVGLTPNDIASATQQDKRWKLIASVERDNNGQIKARVSPLALPSTHPLANVNGATNAITFSTERLGDVTLVGPGAGRIETGYAVISDLLALQQKGLLK